MLISICYALIIECIILSFPALQFSFFSLEILISLKIIRLFLGIERNFAV